MIDVHFVGWDGSHVVYTYAVGGDTLVNGSVLSKAYTFVYCFRFCCIVIA